MAVAQAGDRFTARVSNSAMRCVADRHRPPSDTTLHGEIDGNKILATWEFCAFSGNVSDSVPAQLDGDITCQWPYRDVPDSGHWWLSRPTDDRPSTADLDGEWVLAAHMRCSPDDPTSCGCAVSAIFQLTHSGDSVAIEFSSFSYIDCKLPYASDWIAPITGAVNGTTFSLSSQNCTYTATIRAGSRPVRMSGELSCRISPFYEPERVDTLTGPGEVVRLSVSSPATD